MFTCTFEALTGNISRSHEELTSLLGPIVAAGKGPVKALNSNFGHYCQNGYERFLKRSKIAAKPRGRQGPVPAARQRKPQGDATCFNSALELTIVPGPNDSPPAGVRAVLEANPGKYYAVKSFPTTGQTQVPGVVCPNLSDGSFVVALWARFLTEAGVGADPGLPVAVVEERPIMVNFKFHLLCQSERVVLGLARIVQHLETAKETGDGLPFPIREIKHPQDGQNMSFKFVCPARGGTKKVRVNIFYRGKVNILGACDFESPQKIYGFLSSLVCTRWDELVGLKPLPDKVRRAAGRRALAPRPAGLAAAPAPAAPAPVNRTVAPENRLEDASLNALLSGLAPPKSSASAALSSLILEMAEEFGAEFGFGSEEDEA